MITKAQIEVVLADPERTRSVVIAAFKAHDALVNADAAGRTADGDQAAMVAHNQLANAIVLDEAAAMIAETSIEETV